MNYRAFFLTLLAGLMLICLWRDEVHAQGNIIRGKVRSSSSVNVPRVTVSLENGTGGGLVNQTVTTNEGDFSFAGLGGTSYVIVISAPDFEPVSEHVEFVREVNAESPGESRYVEITLNAIGGVRPPRPGLNFAQNVPKAAHYAFEQGIKLMREGKVLEAKTAMQEAIKIFPDYFDARFVLANQLSKEGKFSEAITQLDEARRINPKDDRVYYSFASVMMQQQKFAVAARILMEASNLNPLEPQYPLARGTALIDQASLLDPVKDKNAASDLLYIYTEAEKSLSNAYDLSGKKLAAVHWQLARLYEKKGDRARAANELEQYLRQSPDAKNAVGIREAIITLRTPPATDPKKKNAP